MSNAVIMIKEIGNYAAALMEWWGNQKWYFMLITSPVIVPLLSVAILLMLTFDRENKW